MIILRSDELLQDYTLREIAECDTKAAILTSFDIINVGIAKSHTKHILATALEHIFNDQPALFANALPMAEQQLLSKLLCLQQNQHVEHPVNHRQHLLMQKLHLVLSYEAGDTWHIYMPDNIRKRLCQMAEADLLGPASTNARRPSPTTHRKLISLQDIRKAHPRGLNCPSDQEYTDFANRVIRTMRANSECANWSTDYLRTVAIKVTLYFEDLVSDLGLWKTFIGQHQKLYGKPLPFYTVDADYHTDYPCLQDVQYLIWDALIELQEDRLPNPENAGLLSVARDITSLMEHEFEDIAINDDLVDFLQGANYCNDFYDLRQVLKWFYFDCYLTSGRFTNWYYEKDVDFFANSLHADSRNAHYGAECMMPFNQKIGPLALEPKEWLALFLEQTGKNKEAADVRDLYCSEVEPFQLVSHNKNEIRFRNWKGEEFSVRRTDMFKVPENQLRNPETNGSVGTFARYRGEWFLSGLNSWGDISKPWDGYCKDKQTWTNAEVPNYQHLMQHSGGSALFYFSGFDELREFQIKEMEIPEESYQAPPARGKVKNLIMFAPDEHGEMGYLVNDAECICDPRNPFYDQEIAQKEALNLITDVEGVPGEFVRYIVSHGLLPDAAINSAFGEKRGRELAQQNLDFLARTLRRQEY